MAGDSNANTPAYEVLIIGGRSGSGKSSLGWEISACLQTASVAHCFIEGDFLDQAYPAPEGDPSRTRLTEDNLAALWGNYARLGYRRLIYTNTVSILESDLVVRAMGGNVRTTGVLLTADAETVRARLGGREVGSQLEAHLERSARMSAYLDEHKPAWVVRLPTGDRGLPELAETAIALTGWTG
ncbi:hypothetical protein [Streptomyces sp. BE230]|uniref:hypothetical protein n=1 Tax=Streptomyces sp. BE230 TaxID=3002526 RepID=UPI002ED5929B|nr:hypothetical protein [Streptomyces sp. BE230]